MVQLVFVHGVAAPRDGASYEKIAKKRRRFFDRFCFQGISATYYDPHWAAHGAPGEETYQTIPKGKSGTLLAVGDSSLGGVGGEEVGSIAAATDIGLDGTILIEMAKDDFFGFLNSLAIAVVDGGNNMDDGRLDIAETIADYAINNSTKDEEDMTSPEWLSAISSDRALMERLNEEIKFQADISATSAGQIATDTLGLGNILNKLAGKVAGGVIDLVDGPIAKKARKLTPKIAVFLGDAFAYIKEMDRRPIIKNVVRDTIIEAAKAAKEIGDPLIISGHSMGANILVDMLFDPDEVKKIDAALGFKLKIDLLLSVGTQVGLFQELALFKTSVLGKKQTRPECIDRWWHVYNHMDVLSFTVTEVFDGADQFRVDTKANIFNAHGAYFVSSIFHKRLRRRLIDAGLMA